MNRKSSPRWVSLGRYALFFCCLGTLQAQNPARWAVGDGAWDLPANWSINAVPTSDYYTNFQYNAVDPEMSVTVSGSQTASYLQLARSQTLTLEMANGSTLALTGNITRVGASAATGFNAGTDPASLTLSGPESGTEATVTFHSIFVQNQSSLTVTGASLKVNVTGGLTVGLGVDGSSLELKEGAGITTASLNVGHTSTAGRSDNEVTILAGSELVSTGKVSIGAYTGQRSNRVEVTGVNALLSAGGSISLQIGDANPGTNFGGNRLVISDGGKVKSTGTSSIFAHADNGGDNDGENGLIIRSGGTFSSADTINNRGLVSLQEGGVLEGRNSADQPKAITLVVGNGGRFEAAGGGLASNVTTLVLAGGKLAVGDGLGGDAQTLSLSSTVTFNAGAVLELNLFETGLMDSVHLLSGATLGGPVKLSLVGQPVSSGTWQVFTGVTTGISATFDVTGLDPLIWDTSLFNQEGDWKLTATVIPEPAVSAMLLGGALIFGLNGRRLARLGRNRSSGKP